MGTRADFYLGRDPATMKWLGSTAWDGHPHYQRMKPVCSVKTEAEYLAFIQELSRAKDFTRPEQGWPWPWEDSNLTDYPYSFDEGQVWVAGSISDEPPYAEFWIPGPLAAAKWPEESPRDWSPRGPVYRAAKFPDMTRIQKVGPGDRSGVMIIGG